MSKSVPEKIFYFCFIDYAKGFDCMDHNKLWAILKEMGIPDHLTCLLRNLYTDQEATVRTGHATTDWFQTGKEVCQTCILSPGLCNLYAEYIIRNAELDEAQDGIKVAERNIDNLRYADDNLMLSSAYLQMLAYKMHKNADVGNLISGFSAFSKTSLNIWKFMLHVLLKPGWKIFEHYFTRG